MTAGTREQGLDGDRRGIDAAFRRHLRRTMMWPIAAAVAAAVGFAALTLYVRSFDRLVDESDALIARARVLENVILDRESALRGHLLTGDDSFLSAYANVDRSVSPALDELASLAEDPEQQARVDIIRRGAERWREYAEEQLRRTRDPDQAAMVTLHVPSGREIVGRMRAELRELVDVEEQRRSGRARRATTVTRHAFLVGLGVALVLGPLAAFETARQVRRASRKYAAALDRQEATARSLAESEQKLALAKDAANMGAWHWDLVTNALEWSPRCKALFGLPADAIVNHDTFLALLHPDDRARIDGVVRDAVARRADYDTEMRVPHPDGSIRWIAAKGRAFYDSEGRALRMAGMVLDVTARKEAEEALRDADRHRSEFLSVLSHELRNPLAPIRNAVFVLDRERPGSPRAKRAAAIIARQVEHLTRLIEDLLEVKRISTGKLRLRTAPLDLAQLVREVVDDVRALFAQRSIALAFEPRQQAAWVDGDRTRLSQIVSNLLHNALKFTDAGGHVAVTVDVHGGRVALAVRDDGVGIAPETIERLFVEFVQAEHTLDRSRGGLGLGLALVRGIADLHGGTVEARSEGIGRGAEFLVTLPAVSAPKGKTCKAPDLPGAGSTRRVVIIEDNHDAAESLRDLLEMVGEHEVFVAHDGPGGVAAVHRHAPDVVLCDIGLPGIDGYEVARRIRSTGPGRMTRLIALSGYASAEDVERALDAGFDYHVAKPPESGRVITLVSVAPRLQGAEGLLPEGLATGRDELDFHHAYVLAEAARLRVSSGDAAAVRESLRFLERHATADFDCEEEMMEELRYPALEQHRTHHRQFLSDLHELQDRIREGGTRSEDVVTLVDAVETWLPGHVMQDDRPLADFMRGREVSVER